MLPEAFLLSSCAKPEFVSAYPGRNDNIGKVRRPESVLVVVHTDEPKVLLLKRKDPFSYWQSVTGSLDDGESHADAAKRELFEETGLTDEGILVDQEVRRVFEIDPRWLSRYSAGVTKNIEYEWHYRVDTTMDITVNSKEHIDWCWVSIEKATELVWSWTNREALKRLRAIR